MDYEVFLLSRIKECYDECGNTNTAVASGLQRSGRIITSAAFLVMIVFLGFAAGQTLGLKEFGLALAVAVAVDVTLTRCILVPATMTLLGRANWWGPRPAATPAPPVRPARGTRARDGPRFGGGHGVHRGAQVGSYSSWRRHQ